MADKYKGEVIAIIEIGSNEVRMRIAQKGKTDIEYLEILKYSLNLARDTFGMGMISFEKVSKVCEIIVNFMKVCKDYNIKNVRAVATNAVGEASNSAYILDQIKIKTGLDIKIIDDNTEKMYIFKIMDYYVQYEFKGSALISYTGSGTIGIAVNENDSTGLLTNINIGAQRIFELFENVYENSREFYVLLEEYLATFTVGLKWELPSNIQQFMATGDEAPLIASLCHAEKKGDFYLINKISFLELYDKIKNKGFSLIASEFNLPMEKAETLLPAMVIYHNLMSYTSAKSIIVPTISLIDVMAAEYLSPEQFSKINKAFSKNTMLSAIKVADKYNVPRAHYNIVEDVCNKIFDKMRKVHGLARQDRLLLQVAAILHDCGNFVNIKDHHIHSFHLINGSDIAGLSAEEMDIVANIALYHSGMVPSLEDDNYRDFKASRKVLISKLTAILRIADALDKGCKQKFTDIEVKIAKNQLIIAANTKKNAELEQWAFRQKGVFFKEVFGMEPVLKIRKAV